jgi:DNA polymerase-4
MSQLEKLVGTYAHFLFELAHGEDHREVDPSSDPKSRGTEITFEKDILNATVLLRHLEEQALDVSLDLKKLERLGRTVTLKLKYSDFTSITRSQTLFHPTDDPHVIFQTASELLYKDTEVGSRPIRLIGVSVGNLITEEEPLQLWFEFKNRF